MELLFLDAVNVVVLVTARESWSTWKSNAELSSVVGHLKEQNCTLIILPLHNNGNILILFYLDHYWADSNRVSLKLLTTVLASLKIDISFIGEKNISYKNN